MCVHACVDTCLHMNKQVQAWRPSCSHMCYFVCRHAHTACEPAVVTAGFTTIDHDDRKFHARVHVCVRLCVDTCLHMNKRVHAWRPACSPICSFASIHAHTACKTADVNACFSMINHCDRTFHLHVHACVRLCSWDIYKESVLLAQAWQILELLSHSLLLHHHQWRVVNRRQLQPLHYPVVSPYGRLSLEWESPMCLERRR